MAGAGVAAALLVAGAALLLVALRGAERPRTLEERVREVASGLRCPVCQNLSVADSPSRLAREMRARIADALQAGKTEEEIRAEFVEAYGEWVLLAPPRRGITLLAWVGPAVLLVAGTATALLLLRRWTAAGGPAGVVGAGSRAIPGEAPSSDGGGSGDLPEEDRRLLEDALSSVEEDPE
jgi:cytochrome c-type biogenesis protein CcmH